MTSLSLNENESAIIEAALDGDVSDPVGLLKDLDCDVANFFEYGDWRSVDFRKSDLRGVSFFRADLRGALLTADQAQLVLASDPKYPPGLLGSESARKIEHTSGSGDAAAIDQIADESSIRQAVPLAAGDLFLSAQTTYSSHLTEIVDQIPITGHNQEKLDFLIEKRKFSNQQSVRKLLTSPIAQSTLFIIWRESGFVSDDAIKLTGLERSFKNSESLLTKNSLSNLVSSDYDSATQDAYGRSVDRICDAMEILGLIEYHEVRINMKPISGTVLLHDLMTKVYAKVGDIFAKQFSDTNGDVSSSNAQNQEGRSFKQAFD